MNTKWKFLRAWGGGYKVTAILGPLNWWRRRTEEMESPLTDEVDYGQSPGRW